MGQMGKRGRDKGGKRVEGSKIFPNLTIGWKEPSPLFQVGGGGLHNRINIHHYNKTKTSG